MASLIEYCVDEAGDSVLWGRRGKLLVGTEGCSKYFILGMVCVRDAERLASEAQELRQELLSDPYFAGVPSLDPAKGRTAVAFHAKDDPAEIRRDFFKLLMRHDVEFHAVVRTKKEVARIVSDFRTLHPNYVFDQNQLYDDLARRLFHDKLHLEDAYSIVFARRWKSDRTKALKHALETARNRHCNANGFRSSAPIKVHAASPKDRIELQAADYFLWALQRAYEKGEDRYVQMMWPQIHCVWDVDDTSEGKAGVRYTKEKPLDAASIQQC
ncbi:MAG: DUF3800 domain-containing protein [Armatimonadota bacterium]